WFIANFVYHIILLHSITTKLTYDFLSLPAAGGITNDLPTAFNLPPPIHTLF
ncbi:MAG: hypothetical protein JKY13_02980, partial [Gammaproteobacteria bacterium]|nr:hypothetical protein [Gammaproteobacteria bacterium]